MMGSCISSQEPKVRKQAKVVLLGSGDSGKTTVLKQMQLTHRLSFSPQETESYRQLIFLNLTRGLKCVIDEMENMGLEVSPENQHLIPILHAAGDVGDYERFPIEYLDVLKRLWEDHNVQAAYVRGNEAALPDYLLYYYADLDRFFKPSYVPTEEDVVHSHARTTGISETVFSLRDHDIIMVDVGGQKSERRKWIHCFENVACVLFVSSLSGYDQCLIEDKDTNQMMDAMTVWESICDSRWFRRIPIILFLNKNDLFERKIQTSHIKTYFPDFDGEKGDAEAGCQYFKVFARLALKTGSDAKEREVYIEVTTATDTNALRGVMASVEGAFFMDLCLSPGPLLIETHPQTSS
ncbi:hypothetical protein V8D89_012919 [Ganoderma adspersum]